MCGIVGVLSRRGPVSSAVLERAMAGYILTMLWTGWRWRIRTG